MKKTFFFLLGILSLPAVAAAQTSAQSLLRGTIVFVNGTIIPILFSLAFLFFLVNVVRYFIIGSGNEGERDKARLLALWGILAFVFIISIWGIVKIFTSSLGVGGAPPITPDFFGTGGTAPRPTIPPPTAPLPTTPI